MLAEEYTGLSLTGSHDKPNMGVEMPVILLTSPLIHLQSFFIGRTRKLSYRLTIND
jgi:hypothetical protein